MTRWPTVLSLGLVSNVAVALFLSPSAALAQEKTVADQEQWSAEQRKVWEQEQKYWRLRKAQDLEGFMSLWDERFVGWSGPGIISRSDLRELVVEEFRNRQKGRGQYKLIPRAVRVYDDIGIAFYTAVLSAPDSEEADTVRFHHSWRNEGGRWQIIEGLSAEPLDGNGQ